MLKSFCDLPSNCELRVHVTNSVSTKWLNFFYSHTIHMFWNQSSEHKEDTVKRGSVTAGLQSSQNPPVSITCVLAKSNCWKPSTSLLSSAALSWTTGGRTNITHRLNKIHNSTILRVTVQYRSEGGAHHEDAEHHVVVVNEEDELISSGGKLCCHLQNKVFYLNLQNNNIFLFDYSGRIQFVTVWFHSVTFAHVFLLQPVCDNLKKNNRLQRYKL